MMKARAGAVCGSIATPFKAWINGIKGKDLVKKGLAKAGFKSSFLFLHLKVEAIDTILTRT
jgi:hypothetical protein